MAMGSLNPWIPTTSSLLTFSSSSSSSSTRRLAFRCQNASSRDLQFVLHDALDASGIDTNNARAAREGFCSQIESLSNMERETSICINRGVDLGTTALHIAAEDYSLHSTSSLPFPVDAIVDSLDDLSTGYLPHYNSSFRSSPQDFLASLDTYLYNHLGFHRTSARNPSEPRALYLHSVLAYRSGSAAMLSLIYSEVLKMLRLWGLLSFDVEIYFPHDLVSLPRGYDNQKSKVPDQAHILTSQSLLVEILRNLKEAFWPFHDDHTRSLFLRAAHAANFVNGPNILKESGFDLASAKASPRLERGILSNVCCGDMRCALSACERLILLKFDVDELRDYSSLLYHCGFYKESLQYLKLYQASRNSSIQKASSNAFNNMEEDAVEKLMLRLNLILMEEGCARPSCVA